MKMRLYSWRVFCYMAIFYSVPLYGHPELVDVQDYLRGKLPETTTYNAPETFHLTLVYLTEADADTVQQMTMPGLLTVFGLGASSIDAFDTPEGYAVHLRVDVNPQLTHLQTSLFNAARQAGLTMSPHSFPHAYKPHITLATVPHADYNHEHFEIFPLHITISEFAAEADGYERVQTYPLATEYVVGEPVREMGVTRDYFEWQFSGNFPEVPIAPDIDLTTLKEDDDDPFFVTLPAFQTDRPSKSKLFITKEMGAELLTQVVRDRVTGIRGHLKDEDRGFEYPKPEVYWVGSKMDGDLGWVKGYVPAGETRTMLKDMMRVGSPIALSIYGSSSKQWDSQKGAWRLTEMDLEQIDFAPPKRSGYGMGVVPKITKEMTGEPVVPDEVDMTEPITNETKRQIIREMAADKETLAILPDSVRDAIVDGVPQIAIVREMAGALGVEEGNVLNVVKEMVATQAQLRRNAVEQAVNGHIAKLVMPGATATDDEDDPVTATRAIVREMVQLPDDADGAEAAVQTALEKPQVKTIIKEMVGKASGGKLERTVAATTPVIEDTEENREKARGKFGF